MKEQKATSEGEKQGNTANRETLRYIVKARLKVEKNDQLIGGIGNLS